jgi:hypothetical protein
MERIRKFYLTLAKFTQIGNLVCRSACMKTFRCILNAGVDPTLIHEPPPVLSTDTSSPIIDKVYIQNLIRESGAVELIAAELYSSHLKYSQNLKEMRVIQSELNQTLKKRKKRISGGAETSAENDHNDDFHDDDDHDALDTTHPNDIKQINQTLSSSYDPEDLNIDQQPASLPRLKEITFEYGDYCKLLIDLCLEISVDTMSATILCQHGYGCNALIIAITEELLNNRPDHSFISKLIELLWNCLESYVSMIHTPLTTQTSPISSDQMMTNNLSARGGGAQPSTAVGAGDDVGGGGGGDIIEFHAAIPTLRQLLRKLVFHGYCHSDKEIRNEVIIICNLLLSFPKSIPYFILSGLLNDLVTFATYGEMGRKGWTFYSQPLPKLRNFSSFTEIDLQLKKELWLLISELLAYDDQDIITCVASSSFMNVLFYYLEQTSFENDEIEGGAGGEGGEGEEEAGEDGGERVNKLLTTTTTTGIKKTFLNKTTTFTGTGTGTGTGGGTMRKKNGNPSSPSTRSPRDDLETSSIGSFSTQKKNKNSLLTKNNHSEKSKLPLTQLLEIQILAMSILAGHAHRMMAEFIQIDGPRRALSILCQYSSSTQHDHKTLVYQTFLLLNRCLINSIQVNELLIQLNGIEIFLYYFDHSDDMNSCAQSIKLLTVMCQSSLECQKQLREYGGIECLVKAIMKSNERKIPLVGKLSGVKFVTLNSTDDDKYPYNDENGGEMNVFSISLLSCIWKSIIGNKKNEIIFAEKEGLDGLFDMLEVSTFLIRSMILRLLSDLLQNRHLVTYAYAWRSFRTVRSIGQILAHCWMDEEVRLNCTRGSDGVICNLWNILGNHSWPIEVIPPELIFSDTGDLMTQTSTTTIDPTIAGGGIGGQSQIVKRLNTAILASRAGNSSQVQSTVRNKVLSLDLRGIITSIFQSLGFLEIPVVSHELVGSDEYLSYVYDEIALDKQEFKPKSGRTFLRSLSSMCGDTKMVIISDEDMSDQNLSPTDKQVISICMRYDTLREGEWWNHILEELKLENIIPIAADLNMIEDVKERVFASARAIQFEQMELSVMRKMEKQSEEDIFLNHILQQKNQQIKSEYLKKKSGRKN